MSYQPNVPSTTPPAPGKLKRSRGKRVALWAGGIFVGLGMIGGILNAAGAGKKSPAPAVGVQSPTPRVSIALPTTTAPASLAPPSTKPGAATVPVKTTASAAAALTGFGATEAAWVSAHIADQDKGDMFWNPDPSLPATTTGGVNDAYSGVVFTGLPGRALAYEELFAPRSLDAAVAMVLRELPADGVVSGSPVVQLHGVAGSQCVGITYTSATLGRVVGGKYGGTVQVSFSSASVSALDEGQIQWASLADEASEIAMGEETTSPC